MSMTVFSRTLDWVNMNGVGIDEVVERYDRSPMTDYEIAELAYKPVAEHKTSP